jgi:chemotaxis protein CheC
LGSSYEYNTDIQPLLKKTVTDRKPQILLVDDSDFSLAQLKEALRDSYDLQFAHSGAEGLIVLEKNSVDLVVTDLLMPHISGFAFLGLLRQRYPGIKAIVCSADVQDATKAKAKTLGAAAFIGKPINFEEIRRVVRLVLSYEPIPREIPISPKYKDAFTEVFNIGVGKAADSLSKLVYDTVKLSVPKLEILSPDQLIGQINESFTSNIACIRQEFGGAANGRAYLLLNAASGINLVNALVKEFHGEKTQLTETDKEMLVEVGNIVINSLVGTLANMLNLDFSFRQAHCDIVGSDTINQHLNLNDSDYILYIETLFVVPGRQIGGNLAILLGADGIESLTEKLDKYFY